MDCKSEKRIEQLELITKALSDDLSQIKHDMSAIRRELVGGKDNITEGALPRINRNLNAHTNDILELKANGFTSKERERILHVVSFFEGWKVVIAAIIYLVPFLALLVTILK